MTLNDLERREKRGPDVPKVFVILLTLPRGLAYSDKFGAVTHRGDCIPTGSDMPIKLRGVGLQRPPNFWNLLHARTRHKNCNQLCMVMWGNLQGRSRYCSALVKHFWWHEFWRAMFAVANLLVLNLSTCTLHNFSYFSSDYFKSVFFAGLLQLMYR